MSSELINNISEFDYTRIHIESLNEKIKLFDSDEERKLCIYNYNNCNNSDTKFIKSCRGLVYNEHNLVAKNFPYTVEYTGENDHEEINSTLVPIFDKCEFYNSYEGCLVRVICFNGEWLMTTNKKLSAFKSKWASQKSFGAYFEEALKYQVTNNKKLRENMNLNYLKDDMSNIFEIFCQSILDKKKQYMFLLLNADENRIVCNIPDNPTFFHIGTFEDHKIILNDNINIPYPEKLSFNNIDELYEYVNQINYIKCQGVIIFAPDNQQYKILNKKYHQYYLARGNEPSIKFRYLQVRMDNINYNILKELYPEKNKIFEEYENYIYDASLIIYKAYVDRFIKKTYITVPVEEYNVIKEAHAWYLNDRKNNKISSDKIMNILNCQNPTNLNKIIKRVKLGNCIINTVDVKNKHEKNKEE